MQIETGLQRWLKLPVVYNLFQDLIGGNAMRRRFIRDDVRARPGDKVIDIGCGPAQILPWLPDVDYVGLDLSPAYINAAQLEHGNKGIFVVGDTRTAWNDQRFRDADIAIGLGLLHHLDDDEATHCFRFAHQSLKDGGRFLCLDACWIPDQGFLAEKVMGMDRGQNVRNEQAYRDLARGIFDNVTTVIDRKPLRIPYVIVVLECRK